MEQASQLMAWTMHPSRGVALGVGGYRSEGADGRKLKPSTTSASAAIEVDFFKAFLCPMQQSHLR